LKIFSAIANATNALMQLRRGAVIHFSQEGEDILLERLFSGTTTGFFVDIGAHHPVRFSNTYWAYLKGWTGINVDAAPGTADLFNRIRPKDKTIEVGISDHEGEQEFYIFDEQALNTMSETRKRKLSESPYSFSRSVKVRITSLSKLFNEYVPPGQVIDFMSIDIEGHEIHALSGNDWDKYKPRVLVVEALNHTAETILKAPSVAFLKTFGFVPVSFLTNSVILVSDMSLVKDMNQFKD
jgi:FkbM family methyltransferase